MTNFPSKDPITLGNALNAGNQVFGEIPGMPIIQVRGPVPDGYHGPVEWLDHPTAEDAPKYKATAAALGVSYYENQQLNVASPAAMLEAFQALCAADNCPFFFLRPEQTKIGLGNDVPNLDKANVLTLSPDAAENIANILFGYLPEFSVRIVRSHSNTEIARYAIVRYNDAGLFFKAEDLERGLNILRAAALQFFFNENRAGQGG